MATPNFDRVVAGGLHYNNFHTTAVCSPTRQGFDKFYGFLGGETDHWAPSIYDGMAQVRIPVNGPG